MHALMREEPTARPCENPSAGRFDPPAPAAPTLEPWNGTRIVLVLLVLAVGFAEYLAQLVPRPRVAVSSLRSRGAHARPRPSGSGTKTGH